MIIAFLIIGLIVSFSIHIRYLTRYVIDKEKKYLRGFLNTAIINILVAMTLSIVVMLKPQLVNELDMGLLLWGIAGIIMLIMLTIQVSILKTIYKRAQQPENYHHNFFGKKVLHPTVVKQHEVLTFFGTIPVFLLIGSYFVARLINLFLYGHL
ncbi:MAG TPA: hypothetical protein P5295_07480 [Spirochaetota bacterium]|nr:hypothetical protein [Spirochaetota bacterium]